MKKALLLVVLGFPFFLLGQDTLSKKGVIRIQDTIIRGSSTGVIKFFKNDGQLARQWVPDDLASFPDYCLFKNLKFPDRIANEASKPSPKCYIYDVSTLSAAEKRKAFRKAGIKDVPDSVIVGTKIIEYTSNILRMSFSHNVYRFIGVKSNVVLRGGEQAAHTIWQKNYISIVNNAQEVVHKNIEVPFGDWPSLSPDGKFVAGMSDTTIYDYEHVILPGPAWVYEVKTKKTDLIPMDAYSDYTSISDRYAFFKDQYFQIYTSKDDRLYHIVLDFRSKTKYVKSYPLNYAEQNTDKSTYINGVFYPDFKKHNLSDYEKSNY